MTTIDSLNKENNVLKNKISTLESLKEENNALKKKISTLENDKNDLKKKLHEFKEKNDKKEGSILKKEVNANDIELVNMKKIYNDIGFGNLNHFLDSFEPEDKERYEHIIGKDIIYQNLLQQFTDVGTQFFKDLTDKFSCKLNEQLNKEEKKHDNCDSEIKKTNNNLKNAGFPEDIMKSSLIPLEKYVSDLGSYVGVLKTTKEKTEDLKKGE